MASQEHKAIVKHYMECLFDFMADCSDEELDEMVSSLAKTGKQARWSVMRSMVDEYKKVVKQ